MLSRERVLRTLDFDRPDRIPLAKGDDADIAFVGYCPADGFVPEKPGRDEWGCVWTSLSPTEGDQGQVSEHPLCDWDRIDGYRFPDPMAPGRMKGARNTRASAICGAIRIGPPTAKRHFYAPVAASRALTVSSAEEPKHRNPSAITGCGA